MKAIEYVAMAFFGEYNGEDTADKLFDAVSKRIQKAEKAAYAAIGEIEAFIEAESHKLIEFELGQCKNLSRRHSDLEWLELGVLHIKSILCSKTAYDMAMFEDIFALDGNDEDIPLRLRSTIGRYDAYINALECHNYIDIMRSMQKDFMEYDAEMAANDINQ